MLFRSELSADQSLPLISPPRGCLCEKIANTVSQWWGHRGFHPSIVKSAIRRGWGRKVIELGRRASVAETAARDFAASQLLAESFFLASATKNPRLQLALARRTQGSKEKTEMLVDDRELLQRAVERRERGKGHRENPR